MAAMAVTADGKTVDDMITVVTPYIPRLTNGDLGLVVGYVCDHPLRVGDTDTAFIVAGAFSRLKKPIA